MEPRLNYKKVAPEVAELLRGLTEYGEKCGLEPSLLELVKIRASQINKCAQCLDMHTKDARAMGETEQRIYLISAWRESPFYSERERAALAWTEAVTLIASSEVSDELYENVRRNFSEKEVVALTTAIIAINGYNRLNVPFKTVPGSYVARPRRPTSVLQPAQSP